MYRSDHVFQPSFWHCAVLVACLSVRQNFHFPLGIPDVVTKDLNGVSYPGKKKLIHEFEQHTMQEYKIRRGSDHSLFVLFEW